MNTRMKAVLISLAERRPGYTDDREVRWICSIGRIPMQPKCNQFAVAGILQTQYGVCIDHLHLLPTILAWLSREYVQYYFSLTVFPTNSIAHDARKALQAYLSIVCNGDYTSR